MGVEAMPKRLRRYITGAAALLLAALALGAVTRLRGDGGAQNAAITLPVVYLWADDDPADRPAAVTVRVYKTPGTPVDTLELAAPDWAAAVTIREAGWYYAGASVPGYATAPGLKVYCDPGQAAEGLAFTLTGTR